jgi:Tfp pilus assembly protein PilF
LLKDYDNASSDLKSALKLDPENPYIFKYLALLYYEQGNKSEACSNIKKSKKLGLLENILTLEKQYCY